MAYSLCVRATSKADILSQATDGLAQALTAAKASQTEHDTALTVATTFIGLADEPGDGMELVVALSGSVTGYYANGEMQPTGTGFGFSITTSPITP